MTVDNSDFLAVILQVLSDDATINGACDGEIHPGVHTLANSYLTNTQNTCIIIPDELNENSSAFVGSISNGDWMFDTLIEISVISKGRDDHDEQAYAKALARLVRNKLNLDVSVTFNGYSRKIGISGIKVIPQFEPENNWARYILRCRAEGIYSTS
jgi:hypothetical protein